MYLFFNAICAAIFNLTQYNTLFKQSNLCEFFEILLLVFQSQFCDLFSFGNLYF